MKRYTGKKIVNAQWQPFELLRGDLCHPNPVFCLCRLVGPYCLRDLLSTAALIGSSTNLFNRARTIGGARGVSARAIPLS
jgi:hypothetical protein